MGVKVRKIIYRNENVQIVGMKNVKLYKGMGDRGNWREYF